MPSSSTNYSYDIPTVGSDSTTYGTIINQFVESLSTKLKTVSDKINTAGVGASSTLARINNYISQVNNINNRLPTGVANLLPDPYSGSLTPVSTWPYLNTELQAAGYSPPTTAQEVLDFDYSGFATYLNTRLDSLSARITGLDAPISIQDTDQLVCEANTILNAIGTYKTVPETVTTLVKKVIPYRPVISLGSAAAGAAWIFAAPKPDEGPTTDNTTFINIIRDVGYPSGGMPTGDYYNSRYRYSFTNGPSVTATFQILDVYSAVANNEPIDVGVYLHDTGMTGSATFTFTQYNVAYVNPGANDLGFWQGGNNGAETYSVSGTSITSSFFTLRFVKVAEVLDTVTQNTQVKIGINDIDLSGCA